MADGSLRAPGPPRGGCAAIQTVGANAVRIRKRFDGRCVNTIVFTSPNRRASGTAAKYETAEHRLVTKKIDPTVEMLIPNRALSHSASKELMTSPPPNASTENRAASR